MGIEIERKFLVTGEQWKESPFTFYCQGYLNRHKDRTVRVRIAGETGLLTVKSLTTNMSRAEFEYEVPLADAKEMMKLCEQPLIEKNRYIVNFGGNDWEVDEFLGINAGLVVAELELESEAQEFETPEWIGEEVTDDPRYFNARLSVEPYSTW